MRFITDLKFLPFFLSLSIAAPIAQYFESMPAGNQINNGIESSSNELSTGPSSPGAAAENEFLMATRRQRPENRRYRPSQRPSQQPSLTPLKDSVPREDICQPGSDESNCQPGTEPAPIPVEEQPDTPDPLLENKPEAAGGALSVWGLWNLLNNPTPDLSQ